MHCAKKSSCIGKCHNPEKMMNLQELPPELLTIILSHLPLYSLLNGLGQVSKFFYFFIQNELMSGKLNIDLELDHQLLEENAAELVGAFPGKSLL